MSSHDKSWSEVNKVHSHTTITHEQPSNKRGRTLLGVMLIALLVYTVASADCASGGSCTIASGDWWNWIASAILLH